MGADHEDLALPGPQPARGDDDPLARASSPVKGSFRIDRAEMERRSGHAEARRALRAEPAWNHASCEALYEWRSRRLSMLPSSWWTSAITG